MACDWKSHINSPEIAEGLAVVAVVHFTGDMGFCLVVFKGDSMSVISKLKAESIGRSEVYCFI